MPWESQAQRAKFYATPALHKYIPEFNAATPKGAKLPEHVKKKKKKHRRKGYNDAVNANLRRS